MTCGRASQGWGGSGPGRFPASPQDGYYKVDLKGHFKHFNRAMREMVGYEKHELKGMNYRAYMDPVDAEKVSGVFNTVCYGGLPSMAFDWKLTRKYGTIRHIETSVSLKRDPQGAPMGFFGIAQDITQRLSIISLTS